MLGAKLWGFNYMKQLIIVRKDLNMSPAKLSVQCCHASMEFIHRRISSKTVKFEDNEILWFDNIYTKIICQAKNKNKLLSCITYAENEGLKEGKDFFIIKDMCFTELTPEEIDENGNPCTMTAVGFRPLQDEIVSKISKHYHLYV